MAERVLTGAAASPGAAIGPAWRCAEQPAGGRLVPAAERERERELALAALAEAAERLTAVAAGLPEHDAEIVETGALMAADPALIDAVRDAILTDGLSAGAAILRATGLHADAIAAIGDETLAARADDVRSLGRRAARLAGDGAAEPPPGGGLIAVAHDIGPADVAELAPVLAGIALAGGGATAHAAIVARSLGIPLVAGIGSALLEVSDGWPIAIDGADGTVVIEPSPERHRAARDKMGACRLAAESARAARDRPAVTTDGKRITVLANVASAAELRLALDAGAEGIGLLRTELAFLDSAAWPSERRQAKVLEPILAGIGERRAVVRVFDFGADKSPPFLRGTDRRGLDLLLAQPEALAAQLVALLRCGAGRDLRILLPLVQAPEEIAKVRRVLGRLGGAGVPLGAMIETPLAARRARGIASQSDFLSIGTNDLTASTLGADRFAASDGCAHDPRVLRLIADSVAAAHGAGIKIEVCGEAASDPLMVPLLVGLGVDELSVGAARVGAVRQWVRELDAGVAGRLAQSALTLDTAAEVKQAAIR